MYGRNTKLNINILEEMNMKKLIALLLAMVMVFGLTACGGNTAEPTEAPTEAATEAPTGPLSGTLEELLAQVIELQPVEFMG